MWRVAAGIGLLSASTALAESGNRTYSPPTLKRADVSRALGYRVDSQPAAKAAEPSSRQAEPLLFDGLSPKAASERSGMTHPVAPVVRSATVGRPAAREAAAIQQVAHEYPVETEYPVGTEHVGAPGPWAGAPCDCGEAVCGCDSALPFSAACGCEGPICGCDGPVCGAEVAFDSGCDAYPTLGSTSGGSCGGCGGCAACCLDLLCLDVCIPTQQMYGSAEVLLWWRRGQSLPPLATTSDAGTGFANAGVLGLATTDILFGNDRVGGDAEEGGRITIGRWLDNRKCRGLELRYWGLGEDNFNFRAVSDGTRILARPFFTVSDGVAPAQASQVIAFPNDTSGTISVTGSSSVQGGDILMRRHLSTAVGGRIDALVGYQWAYLDEDIRISSFSTVIGTTNALPQGSTLSVRDIFRTENEFHGATLGLRTLHRQGCWSFGTMFKMGFGELDRTVRITGGTTTTSGGTVNEANEGLLAQSTNIGSYSTSTFAVLPEVNLTLGYRIRQNVDFTFGYNYMMINKVIQPWRTIDPSLAVNLTDPPAGQQRPTVASSDGPYWIQGLNWGLAWKY